MFQESELFPNQLLSDPPQQEMNFQNFLGDHLRLIRYLRAKFHASRPTRLNCALSSPSQKRLPSQILISCSQTHPFREYLLIVHLCYKKGTLRQNLIVLIQVVQFERYSLARYFHHPSF